MNLISWQEIAVRLSFAFILGNAVAIKTRWYQTRHFIQPITQMALGAAMFAIFASSTSETKFSFQLILSISILCVGVNLQKQVYFQEINTIIKLWCAGAAGSLVGYGLFAPAYIGVFLTTPTGKPRWNLG